MTEVNTVNNQIRAFVERVERLEEEKAALSSDIKEIYAEAKADGWSTPTLRAIVRIRKMDPKKRAEQDALLEAYMEALGLE